jgi:hypothetical protein
MLLDEYVEFGKKNRAYLYEGTVFNEATFKVFRNRAVRAGYNLNRTNKITFLGSKKE